jgi:hypothetical protein
VGRLWEVLRLTLGRLGGLLVSLWGYGGNFRLPSGAFAGYGGLLLAALKQLWGVLGLTLNRLRVLLGGLGTLWGHVGLKATILRENQRKSSENDGVLIAFSETEVLA